jgi:hypothetical protein
MPHHASTQILVPRGFANEPSAGEFEKAATEITRRFPPHVFRSRERSACLVSLSCRFFIRGFPPNKNAAKPSGNPTSASRFQRGGWGSERLAPVGFPDHGSKTRQRRALWRFPPGIARQDNPHRVLPPLGRSHLTNI